MTGNLFQRFQDAADPSRPLIRSLDRPPLSYAVCFAVAARFAHVLAHHGVRPGDRVAVQVEKSPNALCLYLACLRAGAVYLPLNTGYTPTELAYFIGDAEPRLLICSEKNRPKIAAALPSTEILTLGDDGLSGTLITQVATAPPDFPDAGVGMNALASLLYTS